MEVTTCDHNLGFLGLVLRESYFNPLNIGNPFVPPTDPGPAPINATGKDAQITEFFQLYKDNKEKFTIYCEIFIILISIITNKCQENTLPLLNMISTNFFDVKLLLFLLTYTLSTELSHPPISQKISNA